MKTNLTHYRTCVCNINYHIVWSVKYRRKVLTHQVETVLRQWADITAQRNGFVIHLLEVGDMDHVHCFVSAPPTVAISHIVKSLKGTTGRQLFACFPELRKRLWKGILWNPSYYVKTIGCVSEENIRRYIEYQAKQ